MDKIEIIESNYSLSKSNYNAFQFKLPLDFYTTVPVDDPVTSFVEIMKGIDTTKYFKNNPHRGNQGYDPNMMLNVVLYAFMNKIPSLRELEQLCKYDIRYMWMADNETPSFMAFQRFISTQLNASIKSIFYDVCRRLIELDNIDTSVLYIDGTKIEANARKNSFVWKKAILSNRSKLFDKTRSAIRSLNHLTASSFDEKSTYKSHEIGVICDYIMKLICDNGVDIVYGKGKRKHYLQKEYDQMLDFYIKLMRYEEMLEICGERNSYSKTDHDATMMNMKYDYYNKTGVFKPGYNLQIGTSDGYVLHADIFPNPGDTKTFIPFMESYKKEYRYYPKWPVGDAGYGSYENYMFCIVNNMELGLKYNYYSKKNEPSFKKKIYNSINFTTDKNGFKVCPQGHSFSTLEKESWDDRGKYLQISSVYSCGMCNGCPVKDSCTKAHKKRKLTVNHILDEMHAKVDENLSTAKGKEMKKQRSIQTEGAFGVLKYDYGYERIRRRGMDNARTELLLILLGFNLRKYHNKKHKQSKLED